MSGNDEDARARATAHDRAQRERRDGYLDPINGLFVMTEAYLWARGTCCGSCCRHCPYRPAGGRGRRPAP